MKDAIKVKRSPKINCPDCFMLLDVKRNVLYFACGHCGCVIEVVEAKTVKSEDIIVTFNGVVCEPVSEDDLINLKSTIEKDYVNTISMCKWVECPYLSECKTKQVGG